MLKVIRAACGNVDSCTPGTTHLYPAPGEFVILLYSGTYYIRGEDVRSYDLRDGEVVTVDSFDVESHSVVVAIDDDEVVIPIDDLNWPDEMLIVGEIKEA